MQRQGQMAFFPMLLAADKYIIDKSSQPVSFERMIKSTISRGGVL